MHFRKVYLVHLWPNLNFLTCRAQMKCLSYTSDWKLIIIRNFTELRHLNSEGFEMLHKDVYLVCLLLLFSLSSSGSFKDPYPQNSDQDAFRGSDQYDFAIVLPAGGLQCYWHYAQYGERFYLNFMVSKTFSPVSYFIWKTKKTFKHLYGFV